MIVGFFRNVFNGIFNILIIYSTLLCIFSIDNSFAKKYGFLITNPPYGERLEEKAALPAIYKALGERYRALDSWSLYMITSYEAAQQHIGRKADKNRKIYNGMMKTYFYQFMGPKPPARTQD